MRKLTFENQRYNTFWEIRPVAETNQPWRVPKVLTPISIKINPSLKLILLEQTQLLTCFGFVTRQKWFVLRRINLRKASFLIDDGVKCGTVILWAKGAVLGALIKSYSQPFGLRPTLEHQMSLKKSWIFDFFTRNRLLDSIKGSETGAFFLIKLAHRAGQHVLLGVYGAGAGCSKLLFFTWPSSRDPIQLDHPCSKVVGDSGCSAILLAATEDLFTLNSRWNYG